MVKSMSYEKYQQILEYGKNNDQREYYIQRRLIEPFIESIVPDLYIEDISVIRHNAKSTAHNRKKYCGSNDEDKIVPPDLLIVKDWNYYNNTDDNLDYRGVVEVKNPFPRDEYIYDNTRDDRLHPYEFEEYDDLIKRKISWYMKATENNRVILTDGLKWDFFKKKKISSEDYKIELLKSVKLVNVDKDEKLGGKLKPNGEMMKKTKTTWNWINTQKPYDELVEYILNFLGDKNLENGVRKH